MIYLTAHCPSALKFCPIPSTREIARKVIQFAKAIVNFVKSFFTSRNHEETILNRPHSEPRHKNPIIATLLERIELNQNWSNEQINRFVHDFNNVLTDEQIEETLALIPPRAAPRPPTSSPPHQIPLTMNYRYNIIIRLVNELLLPPVSRNQSDLTEYTRSRANEMGMLTQPDVERDTL